MPTILLTNDDGVDSPALVPLARALASLGDVRVVVPDRERSWIGKAITRHDPVEVAVVERDGIRIHTCSGYPADAAQLGIHSLFDDPPDVVVSGVNVGINAGAGFLMSSGTVGAATEGWISGIPAVAFSTGPTTMPWPQWVPLVWSDDGAGGWEQQARLSAAILADVLAAGLDRYADVISVNAPWEADETTARRLTTVARVGYDQLFHRVDEHGHYVHDFGSLVHRDDVRDHTDVAAFEHGEISITPLRMPDAADVPDDVARAVQRD